MKETLETHLRDFAKLNGMTVREIPWAQAQKDKEEDRLRDAQEIAQGLATPMEVNLRNASGFGCGRLVVIDDSRAYL